MSYAGLGQVRPGARGNSNDNSPTRGNSNDSSPTEVRSPTSTSTSTEVRSPTSTSTDAYTRGNVTVTGGAGAGAYTNVRVFQSPPGDYPERKGRAAGRTQERIVRDSIRGLMAPRPRGTPIPLRSDTVRRYGLMAPRPRGTPIPLQTSTTQNVGLRGIGSYSGFGQVPDERITAGALAQTDPFMSKASLMASNVMKNMVPVPKAQRVVWLRNKLNGLWPAMGDEVMASIVRISAGGTPRDQAIFDAIRLALANRLMGFAGSAAAAQGAVSGLGDFASDARTFACTSASMGAQVGGFIGAFSAGADTSVIGGANAGASIANCNLETLRAQAEIAAAQANVAANATAASTDRTVKLVALGIGGILVLAVAAKIALK